MNEVNLFVKQELIMNKYHLGRTWSSQIDLRIRF